MYENRLIFISRYTSMQITIFNFQIKIDHRTSSWRKLYGDNSISTRVFVYTRSPLATEAKKALNFKLYFRVKELRRLEQHALVFFAALENSRLNFVTRNNLQRDVESSGVKKS